MPEQSIALGPSVAVCLGSGMTKRGAASKTTSLRALAAVRLAKANPKMTIILSGDGRKETDPALRSALPTEAAIMAALLKKNGISTDRLFLEDESCDTIGNAILTAVRHLQGQTPRRLYVVTSPFHIQRALACFKGVLGDQWEIIPLACAPDADDESRGAKEQGGIDWTNAFFKGIKEGDLAACVKRLLQVGKPYYSQLKRLQTLVESPSAQTNNSVEQTLTKV